jgi:hypothetical protein
MVDVAADEEPDPGCHDHELRDPGRRRCIRLEVGKEVTAVAPLWLASTSSPISRRRQEEP